MYTWKQFLAVGSNLVDPASSYMLVSKIKPCMSKHKCVYSEAAGAHYISYRLFDGRLPRIPLVILELILAQGGDSRTRVFIRYYQPFGRW